MQSNTIPNFVWTLGTGAADLSLNQYLGVKITSGNTEEGGTALAITGATDNVVGFQQNSPTDANQQISLESNGIVLARVGATVTAGVEVSIMATGEVEDQNASNTTVGNALTDGAAGDLISIKLKNM